MKLKTHIRATGTYCDVQIKATITTDMLTRDESKDRQKQIADRIFNALREQGYHCQDISVTP